MSERPRAIYVGKPPSAEVAVRTRLKPRVVPGYVNPLVGYFLASLHHAFDVTEMSLAAFWRRHARGAIDTDVLVVHAQCGRGSGRRSVEVLGELGALPSPKILFIAKDRPEAMVADHVADRFDVVFKREPFRDRDRYALADRNRAKVRATMLACPLALPRRGGVRSTDPRTYGYPQPASGPRSDVFFSGAASDPSRAAALRAIRQEFRLHGGIQAAPAGDVVPAELRGRRLRRGKAYVTAIRDAKLNLAPSGIGPFTFRHLEILCLASVVVSNPGIRELELPLDLVEGEHYLAYDDVDHLVDLCRHYLAHDDERVAIARAGRRAFEAGYSFARHGEQIRGALDAAVATRLRDA